jgi:hypothetical protein
MLSVIVNGDYPQIHGGQQIIILNPICRLLRICGRSF